MMPKSEARKASEEKPVTPTIPRILEMVNVQMSARQQRALRRIDAENYNLVIYLARRELTRRGVNLTESFYYAGCVALKQYYATVVFDELNMHALADTLDDFWHAHMLDTARYELLCTDIGGFMHHDPLDKADVAKVKAVKEIYQYTRELLSHLFTEPNLDTRFHPPTITDEAVVCLHDTDNIRSTGIPRDVLPSNPRIQELRQAYSNAARRKLIKRELRAALA